MKLTLPYPPSANRYWRTFKGRMLVSREARAYKVAAALQAKAAGLSAPLEQAVAVVLRVYRPRRIGDLDNSIKVTLDSLRGVAFLDDKQVVRIEAERHDDKANPRVEVEVVEA